MAVKSTQILTFETAEPVVMTVREITSFETAPWVNVMAVVNLAGTIAILTRERMVVRHSFRETFITVEAAILHVLPITFKQFVKQGLVKLDPAWPTITIVIIICVWMDVKWTFALTLRIVQLVAECVLCPSHQHICAQPVLVKWALVITITETVTRWMPMAAKSEF
jgi:hypothetical protein